MADSLQSGIDRSLDELIGTGYRENAEELEKLLAYKDDDAAIEKLLNIKADNKKALCDYLKQTQNVELNPESIFDIQIKRLHEYKRQQMNALYVIHKYKEIKAGKKPSTPITVIFWSKGSTGLCDCKRYHSPDFMFTGINQQ